MKVLLSCSILVAFICLMKVEMYDSYRVEDDAAGSAMEGMTNLFHTLFPLVPEHAHFFWRTNQLGTATVHRTGPVREVIRDPDGGGFPWRLQIEFRKRGPDCMGKCITQGVLHPVQCHSLC